MKVHVVEVQVEARGDRHRATVVWGPHILGRASRDTERAAVLAALALAAGDVADQLQQVLPRQVADAVQGTLDRPVPRASARLPETGDR